MASDSQSTTFDLFSLLPTELRLKIWQHAYKSSPPRLIPFHLHTSDLDYLRYRRKACQNYPHIFCSYLPAPPLLHACPEARTFLLPNYTLGFDISRILSMGKADDDVEMYTTCSHEVACEEKRIADVYWDRGKDILSFNSTEWKEDAASVWGGKTGVKFGMIGKVAMDFHTLSACGIGEYLSFEGVDEFFVLGAERLEKLEQLARLKVHFASKGLVSCAGGPVEVIFDCLNEQKAVDYVTTGDFGPSEVPRIRELLRDNRVGNTVD